MRRLRIRQWMMVGMSMMLVVFTLLYELPRLIVPGMSDAAAIALAVCAAVAAFLFIGMKIGQSVVKPLEAMGDAARRIADGDLEFELPRSSAIEVSEACTAFRAMGDGLKQSIVRQSELEAERRYYISAIAHDLRTPLFSLRGYLSRLEKGLAATPEKAAHYLTMSVQKAEQLDRLVSDLFAYAKTETTDQTLHLEAFDFGRLIEGLTDDCRTRAGASGVELRLELPVAPSLLEGDAHLLERAVMNLLDNAIQYTPAGGVVTVRVHDYPDRFEFAVGNTGTGIAAGDLPHLFEPFYRAEPSRSRATGGIGLGLTIARRILRAHGGQLAAGNLPEGGAVFTGTLPRRKL